MRALSTCYVLAGVVLSQCASIAADAQSTETCRDTLWQEAWRIAGAVESPIDAGRTRADLAVMALQSGQTKQVHIWEGRSGEAWVDGALYAYASAAAALDGRGAEAAGWLCLAQQIAAGQNEWKRTLMAPALAAGQAAAVLSATPSVLAGLDTLQIWVGDSPEERCFGALWVMSEWLARHVKRADLAAVEADNRRMGEALLDGVAKVQMNVQAELVARAAFALCNCGLGARTKKLADGWFGPGGAEGLPGDMFPVLASAATVYAAASYIARADGLLQLACDRAGRGQTGDVKAPWVPLAKAMNACGKEDVRSESPWLVGIERAADRPGYHRRVAVALTLGGMASCGVTSNEETARAISLARRVTGTEP